MSNRRFVNPGLFFVLGVALLFPACGGSTSTGGGITNNTPPPPPPPVRSLVIQGSSSGLGDHILGVVDFTTSAAGTLEAHVDWTFASSHMGVYLVRGNCSVDQFNARTCQFLSSSESSTEKPRTITTASTPAGAYQLLVGNYGPSEEAVSYQVFLTSGGSASAASASRPQALPSWTYRSMVTGQ